MSMFIFIALLGFCAVETQSSMQVWLTSGNGDVKLERMPDLLPQGSPSGQFQIQLEGIKIQGIDGFGAALTNAAAYVLHTADGATRRAVLESLFGRDAGIRMGYVRLIMGTSELTQAMPYTYNDIPYGETDFAMERFSIEKDREYVIPMLKEIVQINPDVQIMASPYSLPAWMKNSRSLFGGFLRSETEYQAAVAEYFIHFIRAYEAEGLKIDSITLINEPMHTSTGYPSMRMSAELQRDIIKNHLGPKFLGEDITARIVIWDHNWDRPDFPITILDDPGAKQYVGGTGWHCYGGERFDGVPVRTAHPDREFFLTECSGGEWDTSFSSSFGWSVQNLFIGQTRIGARAVMLKSLVLNELGGPRQGVVGGCSNCRGVITLSNSGSWSQSPEYFATGHFSKFIASGARNVLSTTYESEGLETSAFENPDGSVVIVIFNASYNGIKSLDFEYRGSWYHYELSGRSAVTFIGH